MNPGVLRLIKLIISQATQYQIPITVCGEAAADPRFTPILLGLGVNELSVASRYLPVVKNVIRNVSIIEATQLADQVLSLQTAADVEALLEEQYRSRFPEEVWSEL